MAQPHEYTGPGGATSNYEESWQAAPFTCTAANLVPGCAKTITRSTIMKFTQSNGTVRKTLASSITHNPPQHTEYGRYAAN